MYYVIAKKLAYFLRNYDFSKNVNYLLRKYDFPFENIICSKKVSCLLRKYDSFVREYYMLQESQLLDSKI